MRLRLAAFLVALLLADTGHAAPPYSGTVFLDPDIVQPGDASAYRGLTPAGRGLRLMFDRRIDAFANFDAFLFQAAFDDAPAVEVQVNPEYGSVAEAQTVAGFYAHAIGQLPRALRERVRTVWIHRGNEAFGGGNDNLLIHTGQLAAEYLASGILEEVLMHEAVHTSLDPEHATAPAWIAAQNSDGEFISTYARDNPTSEDLAESFVPWYAAHRRADRIDSSLADNVQNTMPARSAYFESLQLDLRPAVVDATANDQYWIVGVGTFEDRTLVIDQASSTYGTAFGTAFDPARVQYADWGTLRLRFTSCSSAVLEFAADDARFGSGSYPLSRVASPAQQRCEQQGFANTASNEWTVGAWFDGAARSGEGVLIDVLDGNVAFAAWFTYGPSR